MYSLLQKLQQKPQTKQVEIQQKPQFDFNQKSNDLNIEDMEAPQEDDMFNLQEDQPKILKKTIRKQNVNQLEKKKNKKLLGIREPWTENHSLISVQPPFLNQEKNSRKKYKIKLKFQDAKGKVRNYTVRFGDKNGGDFVDHHSPDKRSLFALRVRNCESILNPNYWRVMLLNNEFPSIQEAWKNYILTHNFFDIKQ